MLSSARKTPFPRVVDVPRDEPPHNTEAERGCLGAALLDASGEVADAVLKISPPEFFWHKQNELVADAMHRSRRKGNPADAVSVEEELKASGDLEAAGGFEYLDELTRGVPHDGQARYHAAIVRVHAVRRRAIAEAARFEADVRAMRTAPEEAIRAHSDRMAKLLSEAAWQQVERGDADLGIIRADSIKPESVGSLWRGRIFRGKMTLLAGNGSDGKSTLAAQLVAAITGAGVFPDGSRCEDPGACLILAAENGHRDTAIPRLYAAGADMAQAVIITAKLTKKADDGTPLISLQSFADLDYWQAVFDRVGNVRALFADPIPAYLGRGVNDNHNAEVRSVLEPFLDMLDARGVATIGITHTGKSTDSRSPVHKILGSVAYSNLARSVHVTARDPDDPARRLLFHPKCNLGPEQPTLAYRIEEATVEREGEVIRTARAVFESGPVELTADEVMNGAKCAGRRGPTPEKTIAVAVWLHDYLAAAGRELPVAAILDAAGEAGHVGSKGANGKWSNPNAVYRAREVVPSLPEPREGREVAESSHPIGRGGRDILHWRLEGGPAF